MIRAGEYAELLKVADGYTVGTSAIVDFIVHYYGDTAKAIELLNDYNFYSNGLRDYEQLDEVISEW